MKRITLVMLVSILAAAGCNLHGRPAVERKERAVAPGPGAAATETSEPDTVISPGIVEPWDAPIELSARESGWIAELLVKEGEAVRKGQLLAVLDEGAQRHGVGLARAELAEAEAARARVDRGATLEELQQAQAEADAAAARGELARAEAARKTRLHDEGVVSDAEFERATAEARSESSMADRARTRVLELKRGARQEDRQAADARVLAARARVAVAEDSLDRRHLVAPGAGTVLTSRRHVGEFYTAGSGPLFTLGDMSRLQVRLEVDEIDAAVPVAGASCTIYSDTGVRLAQGTVVRLAPRMGRRALALESPTARADVRVREVFVQVQVAASLIPNQRVWGHTARAAMQVASSTGR